MGEPHVDHVPVRPGAGLKWAAAAAALVLAWWGLTVHFNFGGNWTALYCTGHWLGPPAALAAEKIYIFAGSNGYDGQFYHYLAHDPLLRLGYWKHMDAPWLRSRRILVPGLAWLLAAGQSRWVDPAYLAVTLAFVFLGCYWLSRCTGALWRKPAWGLAFLLAPAVLVSVDRLTVDVALAALCVGLAVYARGGPLWKLCVVLVAAGLVRETGLLLAGGCCLAAVLQRQWRRAALFGATGLPTLAWYSYVQKIAPAPRTLPFSWIPLHGWLDRIPNPPHYPLAAPVAWTAHVLDYLALAGLLGALVAVAWLAVKAKPGTVEMAALLFGVLTLFVAPGATWDTPYAFGRSLGPVLLLPALLGIERGRWTALLPAAMIVPRVLLQLTPQALGIARGLLGLG